MIKNKRTLSRVRFGLQGGPEDVQKYVERLSPLRTYRLKSMRNLQELQIST